MWLEKANKELCIEPWKKKKKVIEDHNDDCGNDLSGLGPEVVLNARDIQLADYETSEADILDDDLDGGLSTYWLNCAIEPSGRTYLPSGRVELGQKFGPNSSGRSLKVAN